MELNYLAFAVPLFGGLMYAEYRLSRRLGKKEVYRFDESVANLNVGIAERLADLFTTGLFYFFFSWVYRNFSIFDIQPGVITWLLLFLLTDFLWYWYHRFGHEVNLFWALHVVHHQSDDYNFTVSARITVLQSAARCLFWSVLPLAGFPPEMITVLLLVHGAYPFFTHTQLIGKLGFLEYFLVTPSHHRVHHSSNPAYLDKNYGDVLIVWDKLFGTFAEENEKPLYGLTKPLKSHSFLWQHFHFFLEMAVAFKRASGFREKWRIVFGKPDHIDPRIRLSLERRLSFREERISCTPQLIRYIRNNTLLTMGLLFLTLLFEKNLSSPQMLLLSLFILTSVITTGSMLEQRRWVFHLECARAGLLCVLLSLTFPNISLSVFLLGLFGLTVGFYRTIGNRYYAYLYR